MQDLPTGNFGPLLLMQWTAAFLVLVGLAIAIYRATMSRKPASEHRANEQRFFFDGPINIIVGVLKEIRDSNRRCEEHLEPLGEALRNQARELAEIRSALDRIRDMKSRS